MTLEELPSDCIREVARFLDPPTRRLCSTFLSSSFSSSSSPFSHFSLLSPSLSPTYPYGSPYSTSSSSSATHESFSSNSTSSSTTSFTFSTLSPVLLLLIQEEEKDTSESLFLHFLEEGLVNLLQWYWETLVPEEKVRSCLFPLPPPPLPPPPSSLFLRSFSPPSPPLFPLLSPPLSPFSFR